MEQIIKSVGDFSREMLNDGLFSKDYFVKNRKGNWILKVKNQFFFTDNIFTI